ncbi:hypothetical protein QE152_g1395 [Popillia japonica]|uniref:Uncharacterized protein n=1 Tax=Popillia japonica TaxID=7064 RepID=A0AAW1N4P3_POPJA
MPRRSMQPRECVYPGACQEGRCSLDETSRLVTGCIKAAPLAKLYKATSFRSPNSHRKAHEFNEKFKKTPLFEAHQESQWLKSRRRFLCSPLDEPPANYPEAHQESQWLKSRRRFLCSPLDEPPANYPLSERENRRKPT